MASRRDRAKKRVCEAKGGFRNSKAASGNSCVDCKCKNDSPKCTLYPYNSNCCKPQTPHHVIPKHCFYEGTVEGGQKMAGCGSYNPDRAPCICVTGRDKSSGQHKKMHLKFDALEDNHLESDSPRVAGLWTYRSARDAGVDSVEQNFPQCSRDCIRAQLDDYHRDQAGVDLGTNLKANSQPYGAPPQVPGTAMGGPTKV